MKIIGESTNVGIVHEECFRDILDNSDMSTCSNLQVVHMDKFGIGSGTFYYPKFSLKLDKSMDQLIIKTDQARKYRLWIHNTISTLEFNTK